MVSASVLLTIYRNNDSSLEVESEGPCPTEKPVTDPPSTEMPDMGMEKPVKKDCKAQKMLCPDKEELVCGEEDRMGTKVKVTYNNNCTLDYVRCT